MIKRYRFIGAIKEGYMKQVSCRICMAILIFAWSSIAVSYQVYGEIGKKWNSLGGINGFLGAPHQ